MHSWGFALSFLLPYIEHASKAIGTHARHLTYIDLCENGIASAPGVPGDPFRRHYDRVVCSLIEHCRSARMSIKGRHTGTCKDTFSKFLEVGDVTDEEDQRLI